MYCLFISCWKRGRFPICSIGPSWPFTIGLLIFAGMVLAFLVGMMMVLKDENGWMTKCAIFSIGLNLYLLFGGILGDPGVKPATYLHYTKNWYTGGKDLYTSDSDSGTADESQ